MLLVLHGPAINASRAKLSEIKKKFDTDNIVTFEKGFNKQEALSSMQTESLFGGEQLVVIENPDSDFEVKIPSSVTLALWFDHEIDTEYTGATVYFFPEEKEASIFPLLETLGNRSEKAFFELKKRNVTSPNDTQYILTMVFYLLRSLVYTPKIAKDFVKNKNAKMRAKFESQELVSIYKQILEIDFKIKQGLLEPSQAEYLLVRSFLNNVK